MKRTLTLLAVTIITVNSVGCCCRGMRDWCFRGAYCGPRTTVAAPLYATAPAPSVPVFSHCTPQSPCAPQPMMPQQYALAAPTVAPMAYSDAGCGVPYATEMGCGIPYMTESSCCCSDGMIMPSPEMYPGPGPE